MKKNIVFLSAAFSLLAPASSHAGNAPFDFATIEQQAFEGTAAFKRNAAFKTSDKNQMRMDAIYGACRNSAYDIGDGWLRFAFTGAPGNLTFELQQIQEGTKYSYQLYYREAGSASRSTYFWNEHDAESLGIIETYLTISGDCSQKRR